MQSNHTLLFDARAATRDFPGINRYIRELLAALLPELQPDERLHVILPKETEIPCLDHPSVTIHRVDADPPPSAATGKRFGWCVRSGRRSFMPPTS